MTPIICNKQVSYALGALIRKQVLKPGTSEVGLGPGMWDTHQRRGIKYNPKLKKSYYDILEVTPKATQAQIKKAYYDLSKTYHPDQYRGTEDASIKFRQITEAYEILGNLKKRRMYDKGLLSFDTAATPEEAEDYAEKFYKSRSKKSQAPTSTGRTPIYNFDEWSKLHYESSFERRENAKMRYERLQQAQKDKIGEKKAESVIYILIVGFVLYCIKVSFTPRADLVSKDK